MITGVVLAAGSSRRLGQPKQLLPYRDSTLLDQTLRVARRCGFERLVVTLGGSAEAVRAGVDLAGLLTTTVEEHGNGCSASLRVALDFAAPESEAIVLLLGDQPEVSAGTVRRLIAESAGRDIAVCRYSDGLGHPFWLGRNTFDDLKALHGDKAVWKLIDSGRYVVHEIAVDGPVPRDVDTWDDYRALLAAAPT